MFSLLRFVVKLFNNYGRQEGMKTINVKKKNAVSLTLLMPKNC